MGFKSILLILMTFFNFSCSPKVISYSTDTYYVTKVSYYKSYKLWEARVTNLSNKQKLTLIFTYKITVGDTLYVLGNQEWRKIN